MVVALAGCSAAGELRVDRVEPPDDRDSDRGVLHRAVENGSYVAENDDEAFRSVVERLRDREALTERTGTGTA